MKKLNEKGFSLIQVMIAFGMIGGLSLLIMRTMVNARKSQKHIETKNNEQQTFAQIASYIGTQSICDAALIGFIPGETFNSLQFNISGLGTKLTKGEELGNTNLLVEELQILPNPVSMGSNGLYEVTLQVRLKRKDGNYNMAGTSKNKNFTVLASLCEPWDAPFKDIIEYNKAKNQCDSDGGKPGIVHYWQDPDDAVAPPQGVLTCYLCGPDKTIFKCGSI